ncbi:MAG: PIG-L family deacetylase [Candidatus Yanofskybacteria bacterium]|nr:PIG-L family deacetylase [Candidatus Yanofskybacteria bacterium]
MFFHNVKKVVFVGAHTDDEMVAAGTLRKLANAGVEIKVLVFSYAAIPGMIRSQAVEILQKEFSASMEAIGVHRRNCEVVGLDPGTLPKHQDEVRQKIFDFTERESPELAFILSEGDDHQDHATVGNMCQIVMRRRVPNLIRCHFPWNFIVGPQNLIVPLTPEELGVKLTVIRAYRSQHFRYEFEPIFNHQTALTGFSTKNPPAEGFEIIRLTVGG